MPVKTTPSTPLAARLRETRKTLGVTQCQMADLLGVPQNQVSDWEVGRHEPRLAALRVYAEVARTTVSQLLEGVY